MKLLYSVRVTLPRHNSLSVIREPPEAQEISGHGSSENKSHLKKVWRCVNLSTETSLHFSSSDQLHSPQSLAAWRLRISSWHSSPGSPGGDFPGSKKK